MVSEYVVIMAGGRGERFWPMSRLKKPKHLLPIVGDKPMLRQTLDRLPDSIPNNHRFIITNAEQVEAVRQECPDLPPENIVAEPIGRDTAAAVGLASLLVSRKDPSATFAILPADAVIQPADSFCEVLNHAFQLASSQEVLVTVSIAPTYPSIGYGYIQKGAPLSTQTGDLTAWKVLRFVEKPDLHTAIQYLESGEYFWNAGMFVWNVRTILSALQSHTPKLYAGLLQIGQALDNGTELTQALKDIYPQLEKISVDYAIMEKADNIITIPATFDWDDVGEWPAVSRHAHPDEDGNIHKGKTWALDSQNNLIVSNQEHTVALLGIRDTIVVHTNDATLVCSKARAQDIKKLVQELQSHPDYKHLA
jgi:mannose-1-phosphate guanylyltransferase